jgi:hypothetical protein
VADSGFCPSSDSGFCPSSDSGSDNFISQLSELKIQTE